MAYRSSRTRSTYDYATLLDNQPRGTLYYHSPCEDEKVNEMVLEKMKDILSAYPNIGVPREPTPIKGNVLLGTTANAENFKLLKDLRVTHLLNCAGGGVASVQRATRYYGKDSAIRGYKELMLVDKEYCDIKGYFAVAHEYIEQARSTGGTVLVYDDGVSRSGAICLSYMLKSGVPLLKACTMLKQDRRCALTNQSFMKQVLQFARDLDMLEWNIYEMTTPDYGRQIDRYRIKSSHLPLSVLDTGPRRTYKQENRGLHVLKRKRRT